jgi:hypothetical protein
MLLLTQHQQEEEGACGILASCKCRRRRRRSTSPSPGACGTGGGSAGRPSRRAPTSRPGSRYRRQLNAGEALPASSSSRRYCSTRSRWSRALQEGLQRSSRRCCSIRQGAGGRLGRRGWRAPAAEGAASGRRRRRRQEGVGRRRRRDFEEELAGG